METEIIVALITAVSSIVIAVITKSTETQKNTLIVPQKEYSEHRNQHQYYSNPLNQSLEGRLSNTKSFQSEKGASIFFLISWLCVCTAGEIIGGLTFHALDLILGTSSGLIIGNVIFGLIIGFFEAYVLQNKLRGSIWWIVSAAIGSGISALLYFNILIFAGLAGSLIFYIVGGFVTALVQWWWVLRHQVKGSKAWIVTATIAWVIAGFISNTFFSFNAILTGLFSGLTYGLMTGSQLLFLLNHNRH